MPARQAVLSDPRALRALAHPVRQQVLELLIGTNRPPRTATDLGRQCGVSASAMSYHLRALERWGLVERAESTDGRERPWRGAVDRLQVRSPDDAPFDVEVANRFARQFIRRLQRGVDQAFGTDDEKPKATLTSGAVWLTEEESARLDAAVQELIGEFHERSRDDHPEGAAVRQFFWASLPDADD